MSQVILWFWYLLLIWFVSFRGIPHLVLAAETNSSDTQASVEKFQEKVDSENKGRKEAPPVALLVSATKREIPVDQATRFATIISREEIEASGQKYVIDLLRALPGVVVNQSGPPGRTSSVFLRGTNANQTLVLFDNVQINGPTTGEATLEHLTTENIERIEILRGPQSVLYGADAVGGVIHIITKPAKEPGFHGGGRFEYGTHETFYETGNLSAAWDRFSVSGSGGRLDSKGPGDNNDGYENTTARGHGKVQVTDNSDLDVSFHYDNAIAGIDDGAFLQDPNRSIRSRAQVLNIKYTISLKQWWEQSIQYSFFHDVLRDFDPRNPGAAGTDPESRFKLDTDRHTLDYQTSFFVRDFDVVTMGYEFEHTKTDVKRSQASGGFDALMRDHGWFIQNELTLWKIWTIVAGTRIDHFSSFGTEVNPLVSSGFWIAKTMTKIKGSFGRAFKAPTFNELFFPGFGNPDVQPEKSWGWDAGVEQFYWGKKGSVSAAYFHNSIEDLIQFVGSPLKAVNVARAVTQGIELEQKITPCKHLTFFTNYTYLDAVDSDSGKRLTRRPKHEGKLGLLYEIWRLHASASWLLIGNREEIVNNAQVKVKGYTRLDFALFFDVTDFFQIYGRVEDATDDHYNEVRGFKSPTARFFVGSKAQF